MSATAGRVASKAGQAISKGATKANKAANEAGTGGKESTLNKGAKRDPELYVCSTSFKRQ